MKTKLLAVLNKPFPLRYSVPGLLVLFAIALTCFLIGDGIRLSRKRIETEARLYLDTLGRRNAARLEYYFAHGQAALVEWNNALLSQEPNLNVCAVYDGTNRLLAPAAAKLKPAPDPGLLAAARNSAAAQIRLSPNGDTLAGAFPVRLEANQPGVLYLETNLRPQKDLQLAADFRRAEVFCGMAILLVLLASFYLDHILTWRVARLIAVTRGMAAGDLSRRSALEGMDELAEIGQAFNRMAEQIQQRTDDLKESQGRYQRFVETAYEGIFAVDENLRLTFVNRRMAEMLGATIDEMTGRTWNDFLFLEDAADHLARMKQRQIGEAICHECRLRNKTGGEIWVIMSTTVSWDQVGQFAGLFGMITDITKRKRAEAQLLLQSSVLTACANSIVITDADGRLEWVNPAFSRLTGYAVEEVIGQNPSMLRSGEHPPEFYAAMWATVRAGKTWQGEIINRRKDGSHYPEHMTITPVLATDGCILHYVAVKEDITQQRQMERHRREMQKMEAISHLAGGVAHEFNNIFTAIIGYATNLKASGRLTPDDLETTGKIAASARRATGVTRQLLIFGRQQPMQPQRLNFNETIGHLFNILKHVLGEKIVVQYDLTEPLPALQADPAMIEQIVVNLATRAREAMPDGGRLILSTQLVELDPAAAARNPEARHGRFVCLTVADNGSGAAPEKLLQVFEPFADLPARNSVPSLGLAAVYGIVKQHAGWVEAISGTPHGTSFKIFLPVAELAGAPHGETGVPLVPPMAAEAKTILLVEDDASVRKLASACLRRFNYRVLEAANGAAARQLWGEHSAAIDLLLTDIILPGDWNGLQLAEQFRLEHAGLKIIFSSGYNGAGTGAAVDPLTGENYLPKPYEPEALVRLVWQVLNETREPAAG